MATRSWWGWGTEEAAVRGAEAAALENRVGALLPDADLTVHAPPSIADLDVPAPTVTVPAALAHIAATDPPTRLGHARGKAFRDVVRNLGGEIGPLPEAVLTPRDERELVDVLDWATDAGVAVIPYGGGSSVVGGVEPRLPGGDDRPAVTVSLAAMGAVTEIDEVSRLARIQGGIYGPALEDALRPAGLTLRHFPQSFEFSTLGGWLATRAGGHFATGPTHIDDLVAGMTVVGPAGVGRSRPLPGSGAGPSPDRLYLGSEGSLGIITEAWMRVRPRPEFRAGASVLFDTFPAAVAATRAVVQSGLAPANCRLLDPVEALLSAGRQTGGGVLVLGFESADHPVDAALARAVELCRDHGGAPEQADTAPAQEQGAAAGGDSAADNWRSSFLRMPYQRDALAARSMIVETFETACTWAGFDALHAAVTEAAYAALAEVGATGVLSCRFTHVYPDGPAPYYGIYAAGRWGETVGQWDRIKSAVSEALHVAGGTITHHHAVGRDHRPWYDRQRPDPFAAGLRAAKTALDPAGIMNPGVLLGP